jgi:hypothetical protein
VIVAPCEEARAWVAGHRVPDVVFLPYRPDVESYGNIPCASHFTGNCDGQAAGLR